MASFPLEALSTKSYSEADSPVLTLKAVLSIVSSFTLDDVPDVAVVGVLLAAVTWIAVFVGLAFHVGRNFVLKYTQNETELRALRGIALLSTTTLFLPFTKIVFRGLACTGGSWLTSSWACDSAYRILAACGLVVLICMFAVLSLFVATVFIDRNPASDSWAAMVHGRVQAFMLSVKLLLALFLYTFGPEAIQSSTMAAVLLVTGVAWIALVVRESPFMHTHVNSLQVAFAAGYTWLCLIVGVSRFAPNHEWALLLFGGTPLVVFGVFQTMMRYYTRIARLALEECENMRELSIWARAKAQEYRELVRGGGRRGMMFAGAGRDGADAPASGNHRDGGDEMLEEHSGAETSRGGQTNSRNNMRILSFRGDVDVLAGGMVAPPPLTVTVSGDNSASVARTGRRYQTQAQRPGSYREGEANPSSSSSSRRDRRHQPQARVLEEAERAFRALSTRFSDNEVALVTAASFFHWHTEFHTEEATLLALALRSSPGLDTRFLVHSRARQLRESDGSGLSPIDRILFDQKLREVRRLRVDAYRTLVNVWEALRETVPNMTKVADAAISLDESLSSIDSLFKDLVKINPESPSLLREYAHFLAEMRNEPARALELTNKADRCEESTSRQRKAALRHFVLHLSQADTTALDENAALVVISGFQDSLGEIVRVTPAALRLFGFSSKSQLHGQNVNVLLPPPIRDVHTQFLARFRKARTSNVVNKSRLVLVSRSDETIVPAWMNVMEAPPDEETCEPRLTAVFSPVVCSEHIIVFGGFSENFPLFAASSEAFRLLQLDPSSLSMEHFSLLHWFPSLAPSFEPQETNLDPLQMEWLRKGVAHGEITGDLARLVGNMTSSPSASSKTVSRTNRLLRIMPLLRLIHGPGLIPLTEPSFDSDDEQTLTSSPQAQEDRALGAPSSESLAEPTLLVGQVQNVSIRGMAPFFVLTFRVLLSDAERSPSRRTSSVAGGAVAEATVTDEGIMNYHSDNTNRPFPTEYLDGPRIPRSSEVGAPPPPLKTQKTDALSGPTDYDDDDEKNATSSVGSRDSARQNSSPRVGFQSATDSTKSPNNNAALLSPTAILRARPAPSINARILPSDGESSPLHAGILKPAPNSSPQSTRFRRSSLPSLPSNLGISIPASPSVGMASQQRLSRAYKSRRFGKSTKALASTPGGRSSGGEALSPGASLLKTQRRRLSMVGSVSMRDGSEPSSSNSAQLSRVLVAVADVVEPEVRRVRFVLFGVMIWVLVLVILLALWLDSAWARVVAVKDGIALASVRVQSFNGAVGALESLAALNSGLNPSILPLSVEEYGNRLVDEASMYAEAHEALYILEGRGGQSGFEYELSTKLEFTDELETTEISLAQLAYAMSATLIRTGQRYENLTRWSEDVLAVNQVAGPLARSMDTAVSLRHVDLVNMYQRTTTELVAGGLVVVTLAVALSAIVLTVSVAQMGHRTNIALGVFLLIPQQLSHALWNRSSALLNKVLLDAEAKDGEEELGGTDEEPQDDIHNYPTEENLNTDDGFAGFSSTKFSNPRPSQYPNPNDHPARDRVTSEEEQQAAEAQAEEEVSKALRIANRAPLLGSIHRHEDEASRQSRSSVKSSKFVVRNVLYFVFPVITVLFFLVGIGAWHVIQVEETAADTNRAVLLHQSLDSLINIGASITEGTIGANVTCRKFFLRDAAARVDNILQNAELAVLGGTLSLQDSTTTVDIEPLTDTSSTVYQIMLSDACYESNVREACRDLDLGLLTNGVLSAMSTIKTLLKGYIQAGLSGTAFINGTTILSPIPALSTSAINVLSIYDQATYPHLRNAILNAVDSLNTNRQEITESNRRGVSAVTWIFAAIFWIVTLTLYLPASRNLVRPLRASQRLLLLLPQDIAATYAPVRNKLRTVITELQLQANQ